MIAGRGGNSGAEDSYFNANSCNAAQLPENQKLFIFGDFNTEDVCIKSILLQKEFLKTMTPGFQDAELSESMERGGGGNALQVSRK